VSRLNLDRLPYEYDRAKIAELLRDIQEQVNGLSEGYITSAYTSKTAAPTYGSWKQGDFIRNSTPVEAGVALSKYVVIGWVCTVSGTSGTWLPCRVLTGN
jgi:hypothetical protein